ncbi:hypothetical protein T439DRAFT_380502 [Meredithblackwellia eburnea MCA 4105]
MAGRGPLYSFQIPNEKLDQLKLRKLEIPEDHPLFQAAPSPSQPSPAPEAPAPTAGGGQYYCSLTQIGFQDLDSLKQHYKSDWYKYNVKLKLQGKQTPVSEADFNNLVENLTDSISGSDSSSSDEDGSSSDESDSSETNAVSRLIKKHHISSSKSKANQEHDQFSTTVLSGPRSAVIWFELPSDPEKPDEPPTQYGVYRAIFPQTGSGRKRDDDEKEVLDELRGLQVPISLGPGGADGKPRQWTLLMFGGGHFAGMIVSLVPKLVSKGKGKEKEREVVVLQKKTFHRYTTRRKQGGSQGANDNAKGKAKSMGAQLRRYNEMALTEEVQDILVQWTQEINDSEIVFLRCSKSNYKTFFDFEKSPLDKKDPRVRGYSFPTRRPTINELIRSFTELTRVKVSHLTPSALAALDASYLASITPAPAPTAPNPSTVTKPKAPAPPKLTKEEEVERDRWERLVDMVQKGKIEALGGFLDKYGPELEVVTSSSATVEGRGWGSLPSWMEESKTTPTLLHVASAADQPEMVRWLLVEKRADPTVLSPARGFTPYEMSPSRSTRNVFRQLMAEEPSWWEWQSKGRVPSGLNEEKENEREAKLKERRKGLKEKMKEREKEKEAREEEERRREEEERRNNPPPPPAPVQVKEGPQRLGGGPPRAIMNRQMDQAGLTEEQRMRVMREQRARAAEARLGGGAGAGAGR